LTEEVEAHWGLISPEVALLLLRDRGWSANQYARWLARQTVHQVKSVRSSTRRQGRHDATTGSVRKPNALRTLPHLASMHDCFALQVLS
jgi:hypothetical protein